MIQKGATIMQPLSGITVLDFTTLLPGPLATLMLAEAGAEVVKIERPGGEELRRDPPYIDGESAVYALLNRGKKSIVLDLKAADARARLAPLLAGCDVVVEQFRPGVMARLGLGYEAVKAMNPRVVYCAITGYGQEGPRRHEAGHDLNYIAATGLLALSPGPADRPTVPPALIGDIGGGAMPAVMNILLGLRRRDATGEGCFIDIAMPARARRR
jgi:crotonobetainyl-CoA:carnitine CoA-transferase CaiB-like acyl-CoA transferase